MGIMSQKEITDEMEALNLGTSNGGLPKVNTPVDRGDTDALDTAIIEMRRKEVETADTAIPTTYYDKDDQDFTEYRTPVEAPEESLEVAPSIAITQMEKALTKPSTESSDVSSNTDVSSTATYGNLWGRAYHTEAENDSVKQADYAADVAAYAAAVAAVGGHSCAESTEALGIQLMFVHALALAAIDFVVYTIDGLEVLAELVPGVVALEEVPYAVCRGRPAVFRFVAQLVPAGGVVLGVAYHARSW